MSDHEPMELSIRITGEIVESNLEEYLVGLAEIVDNLNLELSTSEEFAEAEANVKGLRLAEEMIVGAKVAALADAEGIYAVLSKLDDAAGNTRQTRLDLERQIKARKAQIKIDIINHAVSLIPISADGAMRERVTAAAKSKRTMETMTSAANAEAEAIAADVEAAQLYLENVVAAHGESMIYGEDKLVRMDLGSLEVEIERRVERQRAEIERAKAKIESDALREENAKLAPKPPPAPASPPPERPANAPPLASNPDDNDAERIAEMTEFCAGIVSAFAPVKEARMGLRDPRNIEAAQAFADGLGGLFQTLKGGAE